ncbi:MAG: hypothetical protein ACPGN3_08290 [Opitutales bacterium]
MGTSSLPSWLSKQKARITADWLHLTLLTAPRVAGPCNVSLRMYLGDLFDRLVILIHTPDSPISPCVGENFHIRYRDIPELDVEDLLKIFRCGKNSAAVLLQQDCVAGRIDIDIPEATNELEWAFKHLRHTELEAFRQHHDLFTHFTGYESAPEFESEQSEVTRPKGSAYPWAARA